MSQNPPSRADLWQLVHTQRRALAQDLAGLSPQDWTRPTLCEGWTVREVVAHLSAAAGTNLPRWLASMAAARFNPAVHNDRRLQAYLGDSPEQTLAHFRAAIESTTAPTRDTAAWLGEVVVHAQDIRHPLGLHSQPPVATVRPVLDFFVSRDFAVPSKSAGRGLRLRASDSPFDHGTGPLVQGSTLALTMALAGRSAYCAELTGPGVELLGQRAGTGG